ncbi:MAG: sulfatase [Deltaproteobacteria bacterium]|nr:sulfatase [Deltaproteobacteria bacterium]
MSRTVAAALLLWALALGCEKSESDPAPPSASPTEKSAAAAKSDDGFRRVVVVHLDTTRVDGIGCFGGIAKTPNIDELCRRGRRYTNAIAPTPLTSPSIASFMTGRLTHRSGVYSVGGALRDELVTLAEVLGRNGFVTGGFTSNMVVANRSDGLSWGFDQGFQTYRAALDEPKATASGQPHSIARDNAAVLTREALAFVDEHADEKFFLWLLYIDPHAPYAPPAPYDTMYAEEPRVLADRRDLDPETVGRQAYVEPVVDSAYYVSRYYGEISLVDRSVGELLERIDALPGETLWVVTADHGESLGDYDDWFEHGATVRHSCVNVPLILVADGVPPGESAALVANVDLAPTILDLLGLSAEPLAADGRSLRPTFERPDPWPDRLIPINLGRGRRWRGVRSRDFVLQTELDLRSAREKSSSLYDLRNDPEETKDVAAANPAEFRRHKRYERKWFRGTGALPPRDVRTDYEMSERLRALGYAE